MKLPWFSKTSKVIRESKTHDYRRRGWGHDYTFQPLDGGLRGRMAGWGHGISEGDFLILENGLESSCYRVETISYFLDPDDMWQAEVSFAPPEVGAVEMQGRFA